MYVYTKKIDQDLEMKIHANKNGTYSVSAWDSEVGMPLDVVYIFASIDAAMDYINEKQKISIPV